MYRKTYSIVALLLIGLIVGSVLFGFSNVGSEYAEYHELWDAEPNVKNRPLESFLFLGEETGVEHQECLEVAESLKSQIESNEYEVFNSVILPPVPDVQNDTVYLLISPGSGEEIQRLIVCPASVEIRFIEASVPREVLSEWAGYVFGAVDVLRDRDGVMIQSAGITIKGTIYVGMEEVTPRNVNILLSYLKGYVPPGILVIRKHS